MLANVTVAVSEQLLSAANEVKQGKTRPSHWVNDEGSEFVNPWPSFRKHKVSDVFSMFGHSITHSPPIPHDIFSRLPIRKPTWGISTASADEDKEKIKATWLGHACFLVELPVRHSGSSPLPSRGARILFDPVFSDRCSPVQFMGPKRYTPPPCKIEEIPDIDAIVISHNHYDHLDTHTMKTLHKRDHPPQIFAPLGNGPYFKAIGISEQYVHLLDWWDGRKVEVELPAVNGSDKEGATSKVAFEVTCTPAQHFTGRGVNDRFKTLWASWVVREIIPATSASTEAGDASEKAKEGVKIFFAGDTGYRSVRDGEDEDKVPTCPAFKEIGGKFGGFDFAMIPIGAYLPRNFMSPIHCAPQDSVRLFQDIKAKKALGMHWGTWVLTTEDVLSPPVELKKQCEKVGIAEGDFTVCDIGETVFF